MQQIRPKRVYLSKNVCKVHLSKDSNKTKEGYWIMLGKETAGCVGAYRMILTQSENFRLNMSGTEQRRSLIDLLRH
jgi:hypothetical protein